MIISSISDVHVKESSDTNFLLLKKFFDHESVRKSDYIVLNGDIFDILIGGKTQYLKKYKDFFDLVSLAIERGSIVVYLEGNHDFHIERLISKSVMRLKLDKSKFIHVKDFYDIQLGSKVIRFTHGDDVEIENDSYQKYKRTINNKFMKFLGDFIVPFHFIEWIGHRASGKSRNNNFHKYELSPEGQEYVKDKFRRSSIAFFKEHSGIDGLVCGHSHCKDNFKPSEETFYINNGFAPATKTFILITGDGASFESL